MFKLFSKLCRKVKFYKFWTLVFFAVLTINNFSFGITQYNGKGPRNIYYLTGMLDKLLSYNQIAANQDDWSRPYQKLHDYLEDKGYQFYTSLPPKFDAEFIKNVKTIFWHNTPNLPMCSLLGKTLLEKVIIIITEPPHVFPANYDASLHTHFKKILTWDDTIIDNRKYFKYFFVQASLEIKNTIPSFENKKLCTLICGNKNFSHKNELYSKRKEAIVFFENNAPEDFDFYGMGWTNCPYQTYKGCVKSKTDTLMKYKFAICYENISNQRGYITEKIFGCFIAGCVPIYWGAENIADYIPQNCFIDKRKFSSLDKLYRHISTIDIKQYNLYLKNIRDFLSSPKAHFFSITHFIKTLTQLIP